MRLLFLLSNFQDGGIETVAIEYMNNLARSTSHKVTLGIALNLLHHEVFLDRLDKRVNVVHFVNNKLLTYRRRNSRDKHKKNALFSFADELLVNPIRRFVLNRSIKKTADEFDAVIDFDYMQAAYMKNFAHAKKIAFYHFSLEKNLNSERRRERFLKKAGNYDHIVMVCESMLEEARKMFPELAGKFCMIYNAINPEQLQKRTLEPIPQEYEHLTQNPYMVAVSRLAENQKDITTLISAFALHMKNHAESEVRQLLIIGEGDSHAALQQHINDLGMQENIHLLGFMENPQPFVRKAELMVHSAKFEGLGMSLVEALLQGKPIVATDCPVGPREVLDNGKAGLLVPVGDAEAFAEAMHRLLTDTDLQRKLEAGRKAHMSHFLPSTSIGKLCELLDE